jgi:hypothetical protein
LRNQLDVAELAARTVSRGSAPMYVDAVPAPDRSFVGWPSGTERTAML